MGGDQTQMYVDFDRNPKQKRLAKYSKLLGRAMGDESPSHKFFVSKARGTVSCEWKELAKIVVDDEMAEPEIMWKVAD
eukprot:10076013-Karenia_brevis.AAC.1